MESYTFSEIYIYIIFRFSKICENNSVFKILKLRIHSFLIAVDDF